MATVHGSIVSDAIGDNMKVNNLELIKEFEGFSSEPYTCPAGVDTIGYGSTRYADGSTVKLGDKSITKDEAVELMKATLGEYEDAVNKYVIAPLTQNQFDALVSFAYNVGAGNLKSSTLLKKLNRQDYVGAAEEFIRWNRGGGKVLAGLTRRRMAERTLFNS